MVTKNDCLQLGYTWENKEYNFDNLAKVSHFCFVMCFCAGGVGGGGGGEGGWRQASALFVSRSVML